MKLIMYIIYTLIFLVVAIVVEVAAYKQRGYIAFGSEIIIPVAIIVLLYRYKEGNNDV